uniref:Uncharacterized protein n=1 Tax=Haptolina ericina TaxID=156174 RepID=A0A7S3ESY0_9EUKA
MDLLAAVVEEDLYQRPFEFAPIDLGRSNPPAFASFNPSAAAMCVHRATQQAAAMPPKLSNGAASSVGEWHAQCDVLQATLAEAVESETEDSEEEALAALAALEVQCWIELDGFLSMIGELKRSVTASAQLLSLLPPPPAAGWPEQFVLHRIADEYAEREAARRVMDNLSPRDNLDPYIPCGELYPARRRAQRFSFCIWAAIRQENRDLQRVLEAKSTSARLRMAIRRLRDLRESRR